MNAPITFDPLKPSNHYLDTVAQWIFDEWSGGNGDSIAVIKGKLLQQSDAPPSQIAMLEDRPVGFVWLWRHQAQGESEPSLWINALYVHEQYRKRGIASSLVKRAESLSKGFEDRLYAYTNIPEFYLRLGWKVHKDKNEEDHWVVVHVNQR